MAEGLDRDAERAKSPMVNVVKVTEWKTLDSGEPRPAGIGSVSPRSKADNGDGSEVSLIEINGLTPSTGDLVGEADATTPVPPTQSSADHGLLNLDFLNEIRKIIREEVGEAIVKLNAAADYPLSYALSSASGSVVSETAPSPVSAVPSSSNSIVVVGDAISQRPGVRFSDRRTFSKRPVGVRRSSSSVELPEKWGLLFDADGFATARLGQFLRGLAKHLANEYEPKDSLVVTPDKLGIFYTKYRLGSEIFPFADIFTSKAKDANERIAELYGEFDCQFHLVQQESRSRTWLPALTPTGFAKYLTTCILAYPDEEFRRIDRIVTEIPVTTDELTPDGRPEKLPRTITRSFLPVKPDLKLRKLLHGALDDLMWDLKIPLGGSGPVSPTSVEKKLVPSNSRSSRRRYMQPTLHTIGDESMTEDYRSKSILKSLAPVSSLKVGDEAAREDYGEDWGRERERERERERDRDRHHGSDGDRTQLGTSYQGGAKLQPRHDDYMTPVDLHLPPDRFARTNQSARFSSRAQSFPQSNSHSSGIPPPPVGTNSRSAVSSSSSSTLRRARSPPPPRSNSMSVFDVNTSSPTSSTVIYTPSSTFSSGSVSPPLEHVAVMNAQAHRDSYQPLDQDQPLGASIEDTRLAALTEMPEAQWAGGGATGLGEGLGSGAISISSPGVGPGLESRRERHRARRSTFAAVDDDSRGPTWGEYLKSRKAGERGSAGSGYGSGY